MNLAENRSARSHAHGRRHVSDLRRMAELMRQYEDFPLGVADASVIALAERLELTEVATLDSRTFGRSHPATQAHSSSSPSTSRPI